SASRSCASSPLLLLRQAEDALREDVALDLGAASVDGGRPGEQELVGRKQIVLVDKRIEQTGNLSAQLHHQVGDALVEFGLAYLEYRDVGREGIGLDDLVDHRLIESDMIVEVELELCVGVQYRAVVPLAGQRD